MSKSIGDGLDSLALCIFLSILSWCVTNCVAKVSQNDCPDLRVKQEKELNKTNDNI